MRSFFPIAQVVTCFGAAITYLGYGDYPRAVYWAAAAVISLSANWWIK